MKLSTIKQYKDIADSPLGPASQQISQAEGHDSWSFASPAQGKITLLYFGYTSCPDVCPTTMADLAAALRKLPSDVTDKVWVQFVSTDPHRDTAARLRQWIQAYSPTFHAGRASISEVIAAARSYGVYIEKPKVTKHDYEVTHGALVLVLNEHGGAVGYFTELAGPQAYLKALPTLTKDYA